MSTRAKGSTNTKTAKYNAHHPFFPSWGLTFRTGRLGVCSHSAHATIGPYAVCRASNDVYASQDRQEDVRDTELLCACL